MTAGERIRSTVALAAPAMSAAAERVFGHERFAELYPHYLRALHGSMRATVPLLRAAHAAAEALPATDPLRAELIRFYARHAGEEDGHAGWVLQDLAELGEDPPGPAGAEVAELVGAQYYWVLYEHPVALMGQAAVIECHPMPRSVVEELIRRSGLPRAAFRNLLRHSALDQRHRDEVHATLDRLPLTEAQTALVGLSALHTIAAGARHIDRVVDAFDRSRATAVGAR